MPMLRLSLVVCYFPGKAKLFSWVNIYLSIRGDVERDYDPNNLHHDRRLLSFHSPHSLS
jgi:hypothetical protein